MENTNKLNSVLQSLKIKATCTRHGSHDNYTFFDLKLEATEKVANIKKYANEIGIALKMCQPEVKVEWSQGIVRLEFIYKIQSKLNLFDYFTNDRIPKGDVVCLLGRTVRGEKLWMNLAHNPHMIVAGTTGSGKSTLMHNIIANIFNYNKVHLILVDPKQIEFSEYDRRIKNRNLKAIYSYDDTLVVVNDLIEIMEFRYKNMREGVSGDSYSPIVFMVDEFADLIMKDKKLILHNQLCLLAQKCRAAKIYLILGTQRPSVNVISGSIKANFPARISCRVANHVDSKVILDASGAEDLYGQGDALLKDNYRCMERFQIAYTSNKEVCNFFAD